MVHTYKFRFFLLIFISFILSLTFFYNGLSAQVTTLELCAETKQDSVILKWAITVIGNYDVLQFRIFRLDTKTGEEINIIQLGGTIREIEDYDIITDGRTYIYRIMAIISNVGSINSNNVMVGVNKINNIQKSILFPFLSHRKQYNSKFYNYLLYASRVAYAATFVSAVGTEISTKKAQDKKIKYVTSGYTSNSFISWSNAYKQERNWRKILYITGISFSISYITNLALTYGFKNKYQGNVIKGNCDQSQNSVNFSFGIKPIDRGLSVNVNFYF